MPTKDHCNHTSTHRLNIRAASRGTYCPLHTKNLIDALNTLGTPFRIQRLKTKFPNTCLFRTNTTWNLFPTPNIDRHSHAVWRLLKIRTRKPNSQTK